MRWIRVVLQILERLPCLVRRNPGERVVARKVRARGFAKYRHEVASMIQSKGAVPQFRGACHEFLHARTVSFHARVVSFHEMVLLRQPRHGLRIPIFLSFLLDLPFGRDTWTDALQQSAVANQLNLDAWPLLADGALFSKTFKHLWRALAAHERVHTHTAFDETHTFFKKLSLFGQTDAALVDYWTKRTQWPDVGVRVGARLALVAHLVGVGCHGGRLSRG